MSRPTISEWHALNFFDSSAVLTWLLISLSAFSLFRKGRELFVYVFYFTALYFALRHVRHVAIFNFIIILFLPDSLNLLKEFFNKRNLFFEKVKVSASIVAAGFASYFLIILFAFIINTRSFKLDVFRYPEKALQWLAENRTGGNLLVDFNNGSYALWKLYPRFLVSLDGRYEELYPESTMNLVSGALNCRSESRKEALEILEPDYILAPMREDCFAVEYRTLYSDDKYFLYGKR